jgi:endonuclease/exonuclease/phosphatase family metal-dependent hydrolase
MQVMTFNLRFATPMDGANEWQHRKDLVVEIILKYQPDLLGTQEGTVPQLDYLTAHLSGYLPLTAHREVDVTCQYPTVFYRAQGFEALKSGEFWLSQTPTVHRSQSWGSAFPRMVTYGLFQKRGRRESFYFINTHLDHISAEARLQGARMIREHFFPLKQPMILAGDFNEPPESPVYHQLLGSGSPLTDTWRAVHPPVEEASTQHGFDGSPRGSRIDWILVSPAFGVQQAAIIYDNQEGRYPSDHFPYTVEVDY